MTRLDRTSQLITHKAVTFVAWAGGIVGARVKLTSGEAAWRIGMGALTAPFPIPRAASSSHANNTELKELRRDGNKNVI